MKDDEVLALAFVSGWNQFGGVSSMAWEGSDLQQLHLKEWTYLYSKWGVGRLVMLWLILNSVIMIIKQLVSVKSSMCKDTYTHRQIDRQKDKQADRQTDRQTDITFLGFFSDSTCGKFGHSLNTCFRSGFSPSPSSPQAVSNSCS